MRRDWKRGNEDEEVMRDIEKRIANTEAIVNIDPTDKEWEERQKE